MVSIIPRKHPSKRATCLWNRISSWCIRMLTKSAFLEGNFCRSAPLYGDSGKFLAQGQMPRGAYCTFSGIFKPPRIVARCERSRGDAVLLSVNDWDDSETDRGPWGNEWVEGEVIPKLLRKLPFWFPCFPTVKLV